MEANALSAQVCASPLRRGDVKLLVADDEIQLVHKKDWGLLHHFLQYSTRLAACCGVRADFKRRRLA